MTLCTYTQRWSSRRHRETSNVCATMKPEASLLTSHSGTAVHIGESIPVCQAIPLIPYNPQEGPTGEQWLLQSYKRRNKGRRSCMTPQGHAPHMARPANKSNANRCYVCYMCDTLLCVIYEGTHFCPQHRDLLRDAASSHLIRGN